MNPINISEKLTLFNEHWTPKKIGELNGQQILLAKLKGDKIHITEIRRNTILPDLCINPPF